MLLALLGVWWLNGESKVASDLTDRSDLRLFTAELLLLRLVDAETGIRGYAVTPEPLFLQPYEAAVSAIPELLRAMRAPRGNAQARLQVAGLTRAAESQLLLLDRTRRLIESPGKASVAGSLRTGKYRMDAIRGMVARLQTTERGINARRRARSDADEARMRYALVGTVFLALATGVLAIFLFTSRVVRRLGMVIAKTERVAANRELGAPLHGNDEIVATDRAIHRMDAAIRIRTAELQASNEELESFCYSVSHDLRAPLRAISGYSRILEEEYGSSLDAEGKRLLSIVRSEGLIMETLIDNLLEFSRLGRQSMNKSIVDMSALVREVVEEEKLSSGEHLALSITDLPSVYGDRTTLRHVWQNLIANAVKYSSKRLKPVVKISGFSNGPTTIYHVTDNGVGFDMKYSDKLFSVFQRLHHVDEFVGTGVGLAIVKRVVTRHGGRVWADAKLDDGATFSFSLPSGKES